jgi:RNA polymerase-binding transcription factor DksA
MATTKKSAAPKKAGAAAKKPSPQKAAASPVAAKKAAPVSKAQPAKKSSASKDAKPAPAKKASVEKAPAKKAPAKKAAAPKASAQKAPAKKAPAQKVPAKKAPAQKAPAQKAPAPKAAAKGSAATQESKAPKVAASNKSAKVAPVRGGAGSTDQAKGNAQPPAATVAKKSSGYSARSGPEVFEIPAPRGTSKEGIAYTKDFDVKFLKAQWDMLLEERARLLGQAVRLEDEAHQLIEEAEMGDVQFDDEGGEGDTMVVERERDLALSAQARETITEIDEAIERIKLGTYGYSTTSGRPIPRERLEAIPWATELVSEKVGGIGRR